MMSEKETNEWGLDLEAKKAWVFHVPTRVIGRVSKFYRLGQTTDPDGKSVQAPVIALEQGHTFVAHPQNFTLLSEADAKFYGGTQQVLREAMKQLVRMGTDMGVELPMIVMLIASALQAQLQAIKPETPPDGVMT
jgi:hypothetical protein